MTSGLDALVGRTYGPAPVEIAAAKVAEFVAASNDDPARWTAHAPPGWAASLLFDAAPVFFADPEVAPFTAAVIHSEQRFSWSGPLAVGDRLAVSGTVAAVRSRSGLHLVTFDVEAAGAAVVTSRSTFVMAAAGGRAAAGDAEEAEPEATSRGANSVLEALPLPAAGEASTPLLRSASRADLVRYAGATGDFNPLHWDHAAAVAAGLPGVVVHGLLVGAWAAQAAIRVGRPGPHPLAELRLRFRNPLRPAAPAEVACVVKASENGAARLGVAVTSRGTDLVTGEALVIV